MVKRGRPPYPDILTPREWEVLELLRQGLSNPEIAVRLGISAAGARYHVSEILSKLGAGNRREAAAWTGRRSWWATALAPIPLFWRNVGARLPVMASSVAMALAGGLFVAALGGIGLTAVLFLGDGVEPSLGLVAGPTATAGLSPPQRVGPLPTLAPTTGAVVYVDGDDLWLASLDDGQTAPRALTSGSPRARYAGFARRQDGGIDVYYLSQLTEVANPVDAADVGIYRVGVEGGEAEELFRFSMSPSYFAAASVAPGGEHLAYIDSDGLSLLDLTSGEQTQLVENRRCIASDGAVLVCDRIVNPQWSPAGDVLRTGKMIGNDSGISMLVRPFDAPVGAIDIGYEGHTAIWSRDGGRLCLLAFQQVYPAGLVIYDVQTSGAVDVLSTGVLPVPGPEQELSIGGCAWSEDGRLAISYVLITNVFLGRQDQSPAQILILDDELNVIDRSDPIDGSITVVDWLPDSSGILFNRPRPEEERQPPGVYRFEEGVLDLPFDAESLLAIVP